MKNLNPNRNNIVLMHDFANNNKTVDALEKISSLKAPEQLSALKGKQVRFTQVTAKEDMADVVFNMLGI